MIKYTSVDFDFQIINSLNEELDKRRIFHKNPDFVKGNYFLLASLLLFVGLIIIPSDNWRIGFGMMLSGIITLIFAPLMPKRTYKGRKILKDALAYKEFFDKVEKEKELRTGEFKYHRRVGKTPKKKDSSDGKNV